MYVAIVGVKALDGYKIWLEFENGEKKIFDVTPYMNMGRFAELRNKSLFNSVSIQFDTVQWANQLDFDPEFLYEQSVEAN